MGKIIIALHNVHSVYKIVEIAKLCDVFNVDLLVISRAVGSAAQQGISEASKLIFKSNKILLVVNDLKEAIDLIKPFKVYLLSAKPYAQAPLDINNLLKELNQEDIMIVLPGTDLGFSRNELALGEPVFLKFLINKDPGPIATAAIILYEIKKESFMA
ncbi:MAG: RecB-family nuclease [Candidatus Methanomethylicia archaeon]